MRNDLAAANLLTEDDQLHPDFPPFNHKGLLPKGVTDVKAATALLKSNEEKYVGICKDSLTLKPFDGQVRKEAGATVIPDTTRASSILVFEIN